jgi:hypothetical protein
VADLETEIRQRLDAHAQDEAFLRHAEAVAALRAVLDIHKPVDRGTGPQCVGCATHVTFTDWPCRTVLAVARELGVETP